ncbi:prolipoprotein diacylglyceryl transferase [Mycobacterium sp. 1423905.2]|uniref:prolipoprotein diacylglyceryl transferase n=1 Tax=Mycobacterium sp. 1423905.2 TaxID=1856859 RepID=UPI000800E2D2|nr:prolipoprotein diacylglyceryl transferase [Mycobacterium sp. 1423905.2]OBJ53201.1 prolipoprotein diacylglyceryl transferase [Mycobacterium sp. 1423905.2]
MTTTWLAYFPSPPRGVWHLGPLPLRAYALFIIIGILVALVIGDRRFAARGGERGVTYDIALWAVPFGLIGGRLYHLATDWPTYFGPGGAGLGAALRIWDGGLGIWGAVALGGVGAWLGCRRRGIPLPVFADAIAPGIVLAQAIGRLGNYFNQELYGRETTLPWGLEIFYRRDPSGFVDVHSLDGVSTGQLAMVVQPTFLYELLWNVLVFVVLIYLDRRYSLGHGRLFALYVAGYCVGRFCVELLRDDTATHIAGIRINSFTSTFVFIGAVVYVMVAPKGQEDPATARGHVDAADDEIEPQPAELVTVGSSSAGAAATDAPGGSSDTPEMVAALEPETEAVAEGASEPAPTEEPAAEGAEPDVDAAATEAEAAEAVEVAPGDGDVSEPEAAEAAAPEPEAPEVAAPEEPATEAPEADAEAEPDVEGAAAQAEAAEAVEAAPSDGDVSEPEVAEAEAPEPEAPEVAAPAAEADESEQPTTAAPEADAEAEPDVEGAAAQAEAVEAVEVAPSAGDVSEPEVAEAEAPEPEAPEVAAPAAEADESEQPTTEAPEADAEPAEPDVEGAVTEATAAEAVEAAPSDGDVSEPEIAETEAPEREAPEVAAPAAEADESEEPAAAAAEPDAESADTKAEAIETSEDEPAAEAEKPAVQPDPASAATVDAADSTRGNWRTRLRGIRRRSGR